LANNADQATLAITSLDAALLAKQGKRAIYIGIENGYPLGNDLSLVETFYNRGAR
jgi:membrane dipeptidase